MPFLQCIFGRQPKALQIDGQRNAGHAHLKPLRRRPGPPHPPSAATLRRGSQPCSPGLALSSNVTRLLLPRGLLDALGALLREVGFPGSVVLLMQLPKPVPPLNLARLIIQTRQAWAAGRDRLNDDWNLLAFLPLVRRAQEVIGLRLRRAARRDSLSRRLVEVPDPMKLTLRGRKLNGATGLVIVETFVRVWYLTVAPDVEAAPCNTC